MRLLEEIWYSYNYNHFCKSEFLKRNAYIFLILEIDDKYKVSKTFSRCGKTLIKKAMDCVFSIPINKQDLLTASGDDYRVKEVQEPSSLSDSLEGIVPIIFL